MKCPFRLVQTAATVSALLAFSVMAGAAEAPTTAPPSTPGVTRSIARLDVGEHDEISLAAERIMGDKIARELLQDPDAIDDPIVLETVLSLWQNLLKAASDLGVLSADMRASFAWKIVLGKDRSINAFALPGGYLGLHLGLIGVTQHPDELAAVLAHELSHVTQRHLSRANAQQAKIAPAILAALVLGAVVAKKSDALAQASVAGSQALGLQLQLNYSREMEREADRVGYSVAQKAGYAGQGFVSLFEKLENAKRLSDNNQYPYLRTHPLTTERIGDMKARNMQEAQKPGSGLDTTGMAYTLIAARAKALSAVELETLRAWAQEVQATHWAQLPLERRLAGLVIASQYHIKNQQPARAAPLLATLARITQPDADASRLVRLMQGELDLALRQAPYALPLLDIRPLRRPELLLGSQAALALGPPEIARAVDALQLWLADAPTDALAWQLLAQAYERQGHPLRHIRALAEVQGAQGDLQGAIDRLRAAKTLPFTGTRSRGDQEIDLSIINARLEAFSHALAIQTGKQAVNRH